MLWLSQVFVNVNVADTLDIKGLRINRRKMLHRNWHQNILHGKVTGRIE